MGITAFLQNVADRVVIARTAFNSAVAVLPGLEWGWDAELIVLERLGQNTIPNRTGWS
jgi:hypothetical protein